MSKTISFTSENIGDCPGILFGDPTKTKKGLIILQEWWGINQQIQDGAADIAKRGQFVTLVPDLYRGKVTTDNEEANHFMSNLDWPGAINDIQGAAHYLLVNGCTKIGVSGFCMGGALSLVAAVNIPEISAAAPFYGIPSESLVDVSKIKIPLQCHFGEKDNIVGFSSPADQENLKKKLNSGNVKFEFHSYPAGHAFMNFTSPNYNYECCQQALHRLITFMNDKL